MRNTTGYLKMRVLGAIDASDGKTHIERVKNVADLNFIDEDGCSRNFSWRTIQTWMKMGVLETLVGVRFKHGIIVIKIMV